MFKLLNYGINVQSIIDDFGDLIYREIDYIAEAANAQRFNELYAGIKDVFVPKVYSDLTTRKVLVMEWVDGYRLTDSASLSKYGLDRSKLIDTLVQCSLLQILENGFFHADPHAGKYFMNALRIARNHRSRYPKQLSSPQETCWHARTADCVIWILE
jgi:predicted unusual protein kinase regulating ubiquinone biosynthesis (AarF/ABC1/UbiB family)